MMKAKANKRKWSLERNNRDAYLFLLPWLIGLVTMGAFPIMTSLYLSFTKFDLLGAPEWIGLRNLARLVNDGMFWNALRVTFTYVFVGVPLSLSFALVVALLLVKGGKALGLYRAIFYLPSLLGGSVAIAVLWRVLFSQAGVINDILSPLGVARESWIGDPRYALGTLVVLRVWQFGSPMLIFIAGIKQIPVELYESATIDGAGRFRKFAAVTLPMLSPIILFNAIMAVISAFQDFTPAYIISGGTGGPMGSTMFYSLYLYQKGFASFQMGMASMMAWILLAITAVFTTVLFRTSAKSVYYSN